MADKAIGIRTMKGRGCEAFDGRVKSREPILAHSSWLIARSIQTADMLPDDILPVGMQPVGIQPVGILPVDMLPIIILPVGRFVSVSYKSL